jgi:NADH-quinone oxidoreductase subunit A
MSAYLPLFFLLVVAILFTAGTLAVPMMLGPSKPTAAKEAPYECGIVPSREPSERFPVRFYLVAMIFIIFDIEIIFTYPWAVIYGDLHLYGLIEMVVFSIAVFVSFLYLIANGALDWGPARHVGQAGSVAGSADPLRTTESTVRRVGPKRADSGDQGDQAA